MDLIQPGEVFLINTDLSFADRVESLKDQGYTGQIDVVSITNQSMGMEDVDYAIQQIQKKAEGGIKTVFVVFDQMSLPAQNAFLKTLEDVTLDTCIFLYVSRQTTLLSTVLSRVAAIELDTIVDIAADEKSKVFFSYTQLMKEQSVGKRLEMIKPIIKKFDDDVISKQDIISWISRLYASASHKSETRIVFSESIVLLQQPSTLVKYVLEYMVSFSH
jgi:DNA polymerase III delta prime subunit